MDRNEDAGGHQARTLIRLNRPRRAELLGGVFRTGSRSVMFRFPQAYRLEGGDMFGAVIKDLLERTDGALEVTLWFWNEVARKYATPGAEFEVWYAQTVGEGVVLR